MTRHTPLRQQLGRRFRPLAARVKRRSDDESGLAGIVLVIVILWALGAVLLLTSTLLSARQIDERVVDITSAVGDIDTDTDAVRLTQDIDESAAAILDAARPLSGQLDEVIASATGIDQKTTTILQTAQSINGTVKPINANATSINATVDSINARLTAVLRTAQSIDCPTGTGIQDVAGARAACGDRGLTASSIRLDEVLRLVSGIKSDTGNILTEVGGPSHIHRHANSIDCAAGGSQCGAHGGD